MKRVNLLCFVLFSLTLLISSCKNNSEENNHARAVALNVRAIKTLVYAESKELNPKERSLLILKLLDSATNIDNKYYAADINKLSSLLNLKEYDKAIAVIEKVLEGDPDNFYTIMKGGIIYQDYLNNTLMAQKHYKRANLLALKNLELQRNIDNDYKVAFSLIYLKDKNVAINYLLNAVPYYNNDLKSVTTLNLARTLLENTKVNKESNFNIFRQYHSETY